MRLFDLIFRRDRRPRSTGTVRAIPGGSAVILCHQRPAEGDVIATAATVHRSGLRDLQPRDKVSFVLAGNAAVDLRRYRRAGA